MQKFGKDFNRGLYFFLLTLGISGHAWFKSGVCAVGMGSKLVTKSIMDNKQYDELITATKNVLAIINDCKK